MSHVDKGDAIIAVAVGGASGGPYVAGDLYPTRDAAIQGCIDYLRAWAAHSAQGWPANVPGAAELNRMLDSVDPSRPRQLGLFGEGESE